MSSKPSQKGESSHKRNIKIPQILKKSRQKQIYMKKKQKNVSIDIDYGTDSKKCSKNNSYQAEYQQMKNIMQSCNNCLERMSEFKTKKPQFNQTNKKQEKAIQTTNKPFLIDLIQQRVTQLCKQNRKFTKMLISKEQELNQKQSQLMEVEQKFTNILYTLGQQISQLRLNRKDAQQMQTNLGCTTQTPSYLKALMMDTLP